VSLPPGATALRRVGGGDINEAWCVTLPNGCDAFVKTRRNAAPGEYASEARGLRWLAEPGALRTPRVLEVAPDYLVLEWVQPGYLSAEGAQELGRGLALTHAAGAPVFGDPGAAAPAGRPQSGGAGEGEAPTAEHLLSGGAGEAAPAGHSQSGGAGEAATSSFGSLRLPNDPTPDWPSFYAQRRLLPLAREAREGGTLSQAGARAVERVCERLPQLSGPPEPPARLHGDLWSGNVMADDVEGRPLLIDPSAYGGHREVDLAMLRLFGAPSERVFAAYAEAAPLAEGWEERVELWQLLPLLVHAVLFGGSYTGAAERVARRYAG
jgi:fructosamine-3-kinase